MIHRLIDASRADEAWLDRLRRRAYADLFEATWGGWDDARHRRQFQQSLERGHISVITVDGERVGMLQSLDDRAVRLRVGLENRRAVRFYERLGFEPVGESDTHLDMRREAGDGPPDVPEP